jgi:hypothetical protein
VTNSAADQRQGRERRRDFRRDLQVRNIMQEQNYAAAGEGGDTTTTADASRTAVPTTAAAATMTAPPGMKLVDPFVLFRQRNSSGGFLKCDRLKMDHNTGAVLRERGNNKTLIEPGQRRYVVNPNLMIERWVKFIKGELADEKIYRTAEGELAPTDREEFGFDLDEHDWPVVNGKRKDPWSREVYLPMRGADGEVVAFKATGKGAIAEIGELVGMYGNTDRGGKVPVVEIESRSFNTQHDNTIHVPVFRLVDWELWDGVPTPMAQPVAVPIAPPPKAVTAKAATAKPAVRQPQSFDLDDEIPY